MSSAVWAALMLLLESAEETLLRNWLIGSLPELLCDSPEELLCT